MLTYEEKINLGIKILQTKENAPRLLGQMCADYHGKELATFAKDLETATGTEFTYNTARQYAHIWRKVWNNGAPEDLTFSCARMINSMPNPQEWLDKLINEGISSANLYRMMKGVNVKKLKRCPKCDAIL